MCDILMGSALDFHREIVTSAQFGIADGDRIPGQTRFATNRYGGRHGLFLVLAAILALFYLQ